MSAMNPLDVLAVLDGGAVPQADRLAARAAVAELVEAANLAKRAYWLARNSAAGLTNYCEESASTRRCERELSEAETLWRAAELDAALIPFTGANP